MDKPIPMLDLARKIRDGEIVPDSAGEFSIFNGRGEKIVGTYSLVREKIPEGIFDVRTDTDGVPVSRPRNPIS
jgi:hypothetical protein